MQGVFDRRSDTADLTKWGVNPQQVGMAGRPDQPGRGCQWNAAACAKDGNGAPTCWSMLVVVANQTLDSYVGELGAHKQPIAGRAGTVSTTKDPSTCYLSVEA